jgi:hypothetical protein
MVAQGVQFPRRWDGGRISTNLDGVWGMSVQLFQPDRQARAVGAKSRTGLRWTKRVVRRFMNARVFGPGWIGGVPKGHSGGQLPVFWKRGYIRIHC